ncbi:MAG: alpha-N-acetylglucosaminidase C-terminal domain-containing protein [Limisphaerales bacterium]
MSQPPVRAWVIVLVAGLAMGAASGAAAGAQAAGEPAGAAGQLLRRILPAQADSFILQTIPADQGRDVFEIQSRNGKVVLRGNNGIALASALNWYLKYYCHCHWSLKARRMSIPDPLPAVEPGLRRVSQDRWRYFLNYCCFFQEQRRLFSTDHLYAADTFIEMTPPSGDTNFLAATGRAIYEGLAKTDPQAVWVLQGWTFFNQAQFWTQPRIAAFLDAVPEAGMLVLDLFCDVTPVWNRTGAFCGKPWIWCSLQNFGDCVYLGGALNRMRSALPAARRDPLGARLSGIGFVNEGLDYNPVVFDFLFEQAWRPEPVELGAWLSDYTRRAYGASNADSETAWAILKDTVFTGQHEVTPACTLAPSLEAAGDPPYSNQRLAQAWGHLLDGAPAAGASDGYLFDLVSVTRQVLGNYSGALQRKVIRAWRAKDRPALESASQSFLELINDLDELLATRSEYLLGRWLEDAKRWGTNPQERNRLEWNARRVITLWGRQPLIRDYSRRLWSGMLTGFYLKRWEQFFNALNSALASGADFDERAFDRAMQEWERGWAWQHDRYPDSPRGDSLAVSRRLFEKYHPQLAR